MLDRIRARHPTRKDATVGVLCALTGKGKAEYKTPANRKPEIVCYATTPDVDLAEEVVLHTGIDMGYFLRNRNLFVDHRYDMANTVGHCRSMTMHDDGWVCTGQLLGTGSEVERAVISLAEAGTLAMSIAFVADDWGDPTPEERKMWPGAKSIVRRSTALEVSYTALPMNVECRMLGWYDPEEAEKSKAVMVSKSVSRASMEAFGIALTRPRVVYLYQ
jgi:hypothetical protein